MIKVNDNTIVNKANLAHTRYIKNSFAKCLNIKTEVLGIDALCDKLIKRAFFCTYVIRYRIITCLLAPTKWLIDLSHTSFGCICKLSCKQNQIHTKCESRLTTLYTLIAISLYYYFVALTKSTNNPLHYVHAMRTSFPYI